MIKILNLLPGVEADCVICGDNAAHAVVLEDGVETLCVGCADVARPLVEEHGDNMSWNDVAGIVEAERVGPELDESMDGDHQSALASAGMGTDEDYGMYNDPDAGCYGDE